MSGVMIGVVSDLKDPMVQGRVQIRLPEAAGSGQEWAKLVSSPVESHPAKLQLELNDEVLVAFEQGDVQRPFVIGKLWNGGNPAPESAGIQEVHLPTGSVLRPIVEGSASGTSCAVTADLQRQIAPWLASTTCLLKVLALLRPLIGVIEHLPTPPPAILQEFAKAAAGLAPCLLLITSPAQALPLVRDLLCLSLQSLECLRNQSVPPAELAQAAAGIQGVLDLGSPFFANAGVAPVRLSVVTNPGALNSDISALQTAVAALGGCSQ